jgi:hypothetical protein
MEIDENGIYVSYMFSDYLTYIKLADFSYLVKKWATKYGIIIKSYTNMKGNGVAVINEISCGKLHMVSRKEEPLAILIAGEWIYNNIVNPNPDKINYKVKRCSKLFKRITKYRIRK